MTTMTISFRRIVWFFLTIRHFLPAAATPFIARPYDGTTTTTTTTTTTFYHFVVIDLSPYHFHDESCPGMPRGTALQVLRGGGPEEDEKANNAKARAKYIKEILCRRLDYVCKGKRMQDFRKWVQERDGEATIFSMHGVATNASNSCTSIDTTTSNNTHNNLNNEVDFAHLSSPMEKIVEDRRDDPFPIDRLNLDIVSTSHAPASMFPGDPQLLIDAQTHSNLFQLACRAAELAVHFAPAWSTWCLAYVSPYFRKKYWYKWLAKCIATSGPAWIKWGQWSSTRNDMFPEAFCDELAMLHNDAPAHDWEFSQLQMESSLGLARGSLDQVFDSFDQKPLASGSIAQVHKAVLGNKLVAVKIRHPRVAQLIDMDFRIMSMGAQCLDLLLGLSWLRLRESVDQFSHTMAAQAHLHVEGHHLEVLNYNFASWPHVSFPQPFYASSSIIIETFEPGQIVTTFLDRFDEMANELNSKGRATLSSQVNNEEEYQVEEPGESKPIPGVEIQGHELVPIPVSKFLVTTGLSIYLKMLLVDNLMHADLHPGNIMLDLRRRQSGSTFTSESAMVLPGKQQPPNRRPVEPNYMAVTLVDAGMVAQLTDHEGSVFIGLLASLGSGNGREAAKFALQFSEENYEQVSEETKQKFIVDMERLFEERCRGYGTGVDVGHVLRGVLGLIRKHHIRIDANYATLVVNVLCVEGLGRRMFPAYNVLDAARPLLESYRSICYTSSGAPKPHARRSRIVKFWLSVMYIKKQFLDGHFFRKEALKRKLFLQNHPYSS